MLINYKTLPKYNLVVGRKPCLTTLLGADVVSPVNPWHEDDEPCRDILECIHVDEGLGHETYYLDLPKAIDGVLRWPDEGEWLFATTQSKECIKAFLDATQRDDPYGSRKADPEFKDVAVIRMTQSEEGKPEAQVTTGQDLRYEYEQGWELR